MCAPFQFALSTRAGTDYVGHEIRVVTERQPDVTVHSIDGIGADDQVCRRSMMSKLMDVPGLQKLLSFVRKVYSQPSRYASEDTKGLGIGFGSMKGGKGGPSHATLVQPCGACSSA